MTIVHVVSSIQENNNAHKITVVHLKSRSDFNVAKEGTYIYMYSHSTITWKEKN